MTRGGASRQIVKCVLFGTTARGSPDQPHWTWRWSPGCPVVDGGCDGGCGRIPLYFVTLDAVWYQVASGWERSGTERAYLVVG